MGFGEHLCSWIAHCINTPSFSMLINGSPSGFIRSSRGLNQGDPSSSLFFIVVMKVLSLMLKKTTKGGLLKGFETVLNLKVNLGKSEIIPIGKRSRRPSLASLLGCRKETFPINYFGLPLGAKFKDKGEWNPIIEKFERLVGDGKGTFYQKMAKVTLIRSTLTNLPIYFMSSLPLLISVAKRLEGIQRRFLWGSLGAEFKVHCVKWSMVKQPICLGGLESKSLHTFNKPFLGNGYGGS
ncbi:uncharacterized protein LOC131156089 [Malania oleifera]|uniref:uncharacterized protein LOC131156089 n=1 Tax=Malania oleifera TaxID=397392 RepID=UPI0025ADBCF6|nr:uncharacterized protein LOC131156089 [Malania oleifera]